MAPLDNLLPVEELVFSDKIDASMIILHGLGSSGHDFVPIVEELEFHGKEHVKFILPHAPLQSVSINGGQEMSAWYDILSLGMNRRVNLSHLVSSAEQVQKLISREISSGISSERIVLAGFSQGGAVAYHAALTCPHSLAGLLAMSTYFASHESIDYNSANKKIPILVQHGTYDGMVPGELGVKAQKTLEKKDYRVEWASYEMDHTLCAQQVLDIGRWLETILS